MKTLLIPILFALATALCWGMYGPTIGNAHSKLWTPFKPYVFIGVAYVVLAIIGGLGAMAMMGDTFSYSGEQFKPAKWGFLAGLLGALGALCLTSAMMTSKGNALLVMPIVFGGAVTVTAITEIVKRKGAGAENPLLWVGVAVVVTGIVIVVNNTPRGHAAPKKSGEESHAAAEPETTVTEPATTST